MTQRDTEKSSPLERFEAQAERVFEWIGEHPRQVLTGLGGALLLGLVVTVAVEWADRSEAAAQEALGQAEGRLADGLGGDPRMVRPPEPANAEQARSTRETALADFEAVIGEHSGSRAADFASLRAAEVEIDLGQLDAAATRTRMLADELDADDPVRALALRLLAFVRAQQGSYLEAATAFAEGAEIESYPDSGTLWLAAASNFEQAGAPERAIQAYQEVLAADPDYGEQEGVIDRLASLESSAGARVAPDTAPPGEIAVPPTPVLEAPPAPEEP